MTTLTVDFDRTVERWAVYSGSQLLTNTAPSEAAAIALLADLEPPGADATSVILKHVRRWNAERTAAGPLFEVENG